MKESTVKEPKRVYREEGYEGIVVDFYSVLIEPLLLESYSNPKWLRSPRDHIEISVDQDHGFVPSNGHKREVGLHDVRERNFTKRRIRLSIQGQDGGVVGSEPRSSKKKYSKGIFGLGELFIRDGRIIDGSMKPVVRHIQGERKRTPWKSKPTIECDIDTVGRKLRYREKLSGS